MAHYETSDGLRRGAEEDGMSDQKAEGCARVIQGAPCNLSKDADTHRVRKDCVPCCNLPHHRFEAEVEPPDRTPENCPNADAGTLERPHITCPHITCWLCDTREEATDGK